MSRISSISRVRWVLECYDEIMCGKVFLYAALAGEPVLIPDLYIILRGTHPV